MWITATSWRCGMALSEDDEIETLEHFVARVAGRLKPDLRVEPSPGEGAPRWQIVRKDNPHTFDACVELRQDDESDWLVNYMPVADGLDFRPLEQRPGRG